MSPSHTLLLHMTQPLTLVFETVIGLAYQALTLQPCLLKSLNLLYSKYFLESPASSSLSIFKLFLIL